MSRRRWQEKCLAAQQKCRAAQQAQRELQDRLAQCEARCQVAEQQRDELARQASARRTPAAEPRPVSLPLGDAPPGQQYGANLMALSVNLGRELGLRPARRALEIFSRG